jgi:hypothetical protein
MRSQEKYIVTRTEVHGYANDWLATALRLEHTGYKCTSSVLFSILLIAVSRVVSVFADCRDLADAPSSRTVYNALLATLPQQRELQSLLNNCLCHNLPKPLFRKSPVVAMDLTLISYHGEPAFDFKEIFRGKPKSGTSHFHAYATAAVIHKGYGTRSRFSTSNTGPA